MKRIYKYELEISEHQTFSIPGQGKILCVQKQREQPCMWIEVDDSLAYEEVYIGVFGTGHEITDNTRKYIGTFQYDAYETVWHVYRLYA